MTVEREKIAEAVAQILEWLDLDLKSGGLKLTPSRVADFLLEFRKPLNPSEVLGTNFEAPESHAGMVVQSNIPFRMLCQHHLLPALGRAAIGYVPHSKIVGLSKLTRLVQAVGTEKPCLQEYICERTADLLDGAIKPRGIIVVISAEHSCMACRGIATPGVMTTTSSIRGVFRDVPHARAEFFELVRVSER